MADTLTDLRYAHIMSFVLEHPWAITRPMLQTIAGILGRRIAGHGSHAADIEAALNNRKALPQPAGGGVAIIPVYGVIVPRANTMTEMSGGTSCERLTSQLREAMGDTTIGSIVLDIDSPGGSVAGVTELAREIMRARVKKPVTAIANFTMASAAYWIAACATEIVASPSAQVGSVGVLTIHEDLSQALEMEGVKVTLIAAGKYKTEGNAAEPLDAEAADFLKHRVNEAFAQFVNDISRGRGVPVGDVRNGYGQGRTLSAQEALEAKMVDKIATFDETLARLMTAPAKGNGQAATEILPPADTTQEPPIPVATVQDRHAEIRWQNAIDRDRALLELA
jgi:capsid assembly protease